VSAPGSIAWFARHEARLAWRDWVALMTAGSRRRARALVAGAIAVAVFLHGVAWLVVGDWAKLAAGGGRPALAAVTGALLMSWSLMLSQAMESVTRAFYARGDLELIVGSPAAVSRLFAVRIAATTATILAMTLLLAAPFVHVLAWTGGARWLGAYPALAALAMGAVALALLLVAALFRAIGPRRTRVVAQVLAAVTGAAFAIAVQFAAIASYLDSPVLTSARFAALDRFGPAEGSVFWWPARALLGEPWALLALLAAGLAALAAAVRAVAPRFGALALAAGALGAGGSARAVAARPAARSRFVCRSPAQALRRKEWTLLWRDPWLISQTLMQLLYLLPVAWMLWRSFYSGANAAALLVPVLVVAAGQLAGGLAWLAVSGEDSPELIASAPVTAAAVVRAKAEAVIGAVGIVFAPLAAALGLLDPLAAAVALVGIVVAAGSATAIQHWFRAQARRSHFRWRQTSSRVASYAEALSSIGWGGAAALAAAGSPLAVVPGAIALATLAGVRAIRPRSEASCG
jgi:ABC-2 type transport system permease protein